jgi:hypothetical protein
MTGQWSKSRILFLAIGVVLVAVGAWMILPHAS